MRFAIRLWPGCIVSVDKVGTGARRLAVLLGGLYLLAAVAETTRAVVTGDGGLLFWFGTLTTAGVLVLLGTLSPEMRAPWRRVSVVAGACLGMPATAWTVVVPVIAVVVIVLVLRQ